MLRCWLTINLTLQLISPIAASNGELRRVRGDALPNYEGRTRPIRVKCHHERSEADALRPCGQEGACLDSKTPGVSACHQQAKEEETEPLCLGTWRQFAHWKGNTERQSSSGDQIGPDSHKSRPHATPAGAEITRQDAGSPRSLKACTEWVRRERVTEG